MQRRLATAGLLALIASASVPVAWAQAEPTADDPLWVDIAAIESAQQQAQAADQNASSSPVLRIPLRRRSPRNVINAVLNRPRPMTTPGLRGSSGEPGEGDIIIADVGNAQYFGEIQVGSSGQTFEVRLAFCVCVCARVDMCAGSQQGPWWLISIATRRSSSTRAPPTSGSLRPTAAHPAPGSPSTTTTRPRPTSRCVRNLFDDGPCIIQQRWGVAASRHHRIITHAHCTRTAPSSRSNTARARCRGIFQRTAWSWRA